MILAQVANTSYGVANLNRLLPSERELLRVEQFASLVEFVERCNSRERYILIRQDIQLNPGQIELLWEEASLRPYCVVSMEGVFVLMGNAIKECGGDWGELENLGYELIKITEENKNAKNHNAKGERGVW